jgi:hypothetical protein
MAHFAEIDKDGIVLRVLVVDDTQENRGQEFLAEDLGLGGTWIQTSYNGKIRGQFAGIGDFYDKKKDVFLTPKIIEVDEVIEVESDTKSISG